MKYDSAGNLIQQPIHSCNCGFTGGCKLCRPSFIGCITNEEADKMKERIRDWGRRFNDSFKEKMEELEELLENK